MNEPTSYSQETPPFMISWKSGNAPVEIKSGAILPTGKGFVIEANTAEGTLKFGPTTELGADVQSADIADVPYASAFNADPFLTNLRKLLRRSRVSQSGLRSYTFAASRRRLRRTLRYAAPRLESNAPTTDELISILQDSAANADQRRRAVLYAETAAIDDAVRSRLREVLRGYIEENRDSHDEEIIVAVGAAIRKLMAISSSADAFHVGDVLEAGHRTSVTPEIELEVLKSIVWRLTSTPRLDVKTQLRESIWELVSVYTHDRLIGRDKFAAVALNAILALVLMRWRVSDIVARLRELHLTWFKTLVARRADRIRADFERRGCDDLTDVVNTLNGFVRDLSP